MYTYSLISSTSRGIQNPIPLVLPPLPLLLLRKTFKLVLLFRIIISLTLLSLLLGFLCFGNRRRGRWGRTTEYMQWGNTMGLRQADFSILACRGRRREAGFEQDFRDSNWVNEQKSCRSESMPFNRYINVTYVLREAYRIELELILFEFSSLDVGDVHLFRVP